MKVLELIIASRFFYIKTNFFYRLLISINTDKIKLL
jgi:hypothetical protein